ncbi:MAG: 4Fe-4S dicluster domain-containing protein [Candidatus Bathyarchaeia archaeon]
MRRKVIEIPIVPFTEVIRPKKLASWRLVRPVVNKETCSKCGDCALYCPEGVFVQDDEGYYYPTYDYCKGCGVCAHECPTGAIDMVEEPAGG